MANTYSAGIVTAYGAAVRGGYTGTYEEFCAQQAAFAENAEQVAEDRAAVEQIKTTFENQTVPAAVQQVNQAGAAQVQAVQAAGDAEERDIAAAGAAQETRVLQAGADQEDAVNDAGSTQVQAIQTAGTAQVTAVQDAGSTQVQAVQTAGAAQVGAVEDKGAEVLESIPADYTELTGEVGELKSAFDDSQYFGYNLVFDNFATPSEWSVYNSTAVFGTNTVTLTATASGGNEANIRYSKKITKFVSGHKYYVSCQIKSTVRFRARIYVGNAPTDRLGYESGVWNIVDGIAVPTSNSELGFYANNYAGGAVGDVFELKNPVLIDLTEMYGAGNEPTTVHTLRKIINGDYIDAFSGKRYQEIMGARAAGAVIVASKDSSYVGRADYVAVGKADQVLLNEIISNPNVSSVYLTPDSVFSISAPINLKSNFKLFSDGAKITMEDQVSVITTGNTAIGSVNLFASTAVGVNDFAIGMFVEISDGTNTESRTISSISYPNGRITLDEAVTSRFEAGTTVKNVSSALAGFDLSDVVVEGIRVDLNLDNNPQAVNTFYAQNGAHFVRCTRVKIRNCILNNGGRHGILFYECNDSSIIGCALDRWEEHCVDIYESGTTISIEGTPRNNMVSECVLTNATLAGVQNHGGSGNIIENCVMHDNGECGVSCYGGSNNVVISNCQIAGNTDGVKVQTNAKFISVIGCDIRGNTLDGISAFKKVDHLLISGNQIHENGRDGIQVDASTQNSLIIGNNICENAQYQVFITDSSNNCVENNIVQGSENARCIYVYRASDKNIIKGNTFIKGGSTYAVRIEAGVTSTLVFGNVFRDFTTPVNDTGTGSIIENNYSI